VTNNGQGKAFNVVLTDQLLNTLSWSVDPAVQGCSISQTQLLTCQIGTMKGTHDGAGGVGDSFSVTVKATVSSSFVNQTPVADGPQLEIDGNLAPASNTSLDWETPDFVICPPAPAGKQVIGCSLDLSNSQQDNSMVQGTKEDTPVPTLEFGSIPNNKSDLHRFYIRNNRAVATGGAVHDFLYLAWERVNNPTGTTNMDFEFNQSSATSTNGVTPVRTAGDLLIKYDLSQGGGTLSMGFHRWVTSGACEANGQTAPCWGPVNDLTGAFAGQANLTSVTDHIDPGDRTLSALTFGEARIDMQAANFFTSSACVHFGRAFLKSRSSDSFTSVIKDFITPIPVNVTNCLPTPIPNTANVTADNATGASDTGKITVNVP